METWNVTVAPAGVDGEDTATTGHDNIATTIGYVKTAEDAAGSIGETFPSLPTCLVSPDAIDVAKANDWTNDWTRKRCRQPLIRATRRSSSLCIRSLGA